MKEEYTKSRLQGELAEEYVRLELCKNGDTCCKITQRGFNRKYKKYFVFPNKEELEIFIWKRFNGEKEYKQKVVDLIKSPIGLPDFICLSSNKKEIYFVEVKSNNSELTEKQEIVFKKLVDNGFRVEVMSLDLELNIIGLRKGNFG
jgi:hypothetical protein